MADRFTATYYSGYTLYALPRLKNGNVITPTGTNEAYNPANQATNAIAFTGSGCDYIAAVPSNLPTNVQIDLQYFVQSGGSPASSDTIIGSSSGYWTGTSFFDVDTYYLSTQLPGQTINISSPVLTSGNVNIVRGDDYTNGGSGDRRITWTLSAPPSMSSGIFYMYSNEGAIIIQTSVTIVSSNVSISLTAAQTLLFDTGGFRYEVIFVLTDATIATLIQGKVIVTDQSQAY